MTMHAAAHDFAPDLLTLQLSPPSRLPRTVLLGLSAVVAGLLAWSAWAELDIVATAQGKLVPLSFTKVVQPAETGVVSDILVKDGDQVTAGQVLLRLDARLNQTDVQALGQDVVLKRLTLQRIEAELADRDFAPVHGTRGAGPQGAAPWLVGQVMAHYQARRQSYTDALAQEAEALKKAQADLASAEQVLRKLRETVPLYQQAADAYEKLRVDGFVGEVAANEKKRDYVERAQDMKAQESTVAGLQSLIEQSYRKTAAIRSTYRSQLENERLDTRTQLTRSEQELDKSGIRSGLLDIRSPTDGVVKDLAVTSRNAVVQAGALLMNIVPQAEALQAEVLLANEDVGFVAVGQKAQVKVAAYPFQKYGLLQGEVIHLSADATDPRQGASSNPAYSNPAFGAPAAAQTYRALVRLDAQHLTAPTTRGSSAGTAPRLALSSGMAVAAEIHQGKRTVMEYLLSPVLKVGAEAARER